MGSLLIKQSQLNFQLQSSDFNLALSCIFTAVFKDGIQCMIYFDNSEESVPPPRLE